jgi:D-alanine transaminase
MMMVETMQTDPGATPTATAPADAATQAATPARTVYLNGDFLPSDRATISVDDRGFLFGDGIYEVTRVLRGRTVEPGRHRQRLERGLRALAIGMTTAELDALDGVAERLIRDNGLADADAMIYLQITRGAAFPRTHQFPSPDTRPTVYLSAATVPDRTELRARGAAAITVPDVRWARCDLKTVNLLPNALARQQAAAAGVYEALFVRDGVLLEGSQTNLFAVIDGELRTAPQSNYILPGVTRDVVLEVARSAGVHVREFPILADEIPRATELFVTSTTSDVMPIVRLDAKPIGDGHPGIVTGQLHAGFMERIS